MNNRFIIIAPLSSLSRRTRLFKLAKFLNKEKFQITHIGWERLKGEKKETDLNFSIKKEIILNGGGYGGSKIKAFYLLWMLNVFFYSFKLKKTDTVWALGFESAFPLLLASKLKGFKIYFDDADRFSMLFNFPRSVLKIIEKLEEYTSRNVYRHIIPVRERYNFESENFYTLQNMPSQSEIVEGQKIFHQNKWIKSNLVININGWLGKGRGMDKALELQKLLPTKDVAFILAGKLDCPEAIILSKQENVQYLGNVTNAVALASYFASDLVFTYYNPNTEINTLAASNKWGDAIKTNTGVIVNSEVKTAEYLRKSGLAISFPYQNVNALAKKIEELIYNEEIENQKERIKDISSEFLFFEDQLKKLIGNETE